MLCCSMYVGKLVLRKSVVEPVNTLMARHSDSLAFVSYKLCRTGICYYHGSLQNGSYHVSSVFAHASVCVCAYVFV